MEEKKGFKLLTFVAAVSVTVWLLVTLVLLGIIGIHQFWPAGLVPVFFFLAHADTKNVKNIFAGGIMGFLLAAAVAPVVTMLAPIIGLQPAILVVVGVMVFFIIFLGDVAHIVFNNYTFAYYTVALIFEQQHTLQWLGTFVIAGGFFLFMVLFSIKTTMKIIMKNKAAAAAPQAAE